MIESSKPLTKNEELVLYGMVRYPNFNDRQLSDILNLKDSTVNYCRNSLEKRALYQVVYVPILNRLGFEILSISFAEYDLKLSGDERWDKIEKDIEVSNDVFLRIAEHEKEFSMSFNKNYSEFFENTQNRTEQLGTLGILGKNHPENVVFPINQSTIQNFFDYSQLLAHILNIDPKILAIPGEKPIEFPSFDQKDLINLTEKEKDVFVALIDYPNMSIKEISELPEVSLNRHTVSRLRERFLSEGLMRKVIIPELDSLGFELLVYYHFSFYPQKPINQDIINMLSSPSTIFFIHNKFEAVILAAFPNYSEYKIEKLKKYTFLNQFDLIGESPSPRKYIFDQIRYIRKFDFQLLSRII